MSSPPVETAEQEVQDRIPFADVQQRGDAHWKVSHSAWKEIGEAFDIKDGLRTLKQNLMRIRSTIGHLVLTDEQPGEELIEGGKANMVSVAEQEAQLKEAWYQVREKILKTLGETIGFQEMLNADQKDIETFLDDSIAECDVQMSVGRLLSPKKP